MTPEQREKNRLRSERWRRAHGIMPRRPAQRPWLAIGISRTTFYRRKAKVRQKVATAFVLERLDWQIAEMQDHLARAKGLMDEMAVELAEAGPVNSGPPGFELRGKE